MTNHAWQEEFEVGDFLIYNNILVVVSKAVEPFRTSMKVARVNKLPLVEYSVPYHHKNLIKRATENMVKSYISTVGRVP